MKRDMELVRQMLLAIEESDEPPAVSELMLPNYTSSQIAYHAELLEQGGLIRGIDGSTMNDYELLDVSLTWEGHDFLDAVKDNRIWSKVSDGLVSVGGTTAIDVVKAYALKIASDALGI